MELTLSVHVRGDMLILRYFLIVGPLLTSLVWAWGAYLEPSAPTAPAARVATTTNEVFRPTPAPPLAEQNAVASGPTTTPEPEPAAVSPRPEKAARVQPRKPKKVIARPRSAPDNSFAYAPQQPFFFGWR